MEGKSFQHIIFQHKSPLFRGLKDTELWMDLNKIHNLNLAIKKLNGLILQPGMTLSYWKLIGAPYTYRGFKKGMVLVNGQAQCKTGGGLCQLSNLLYWMTLHTPLSVTQRFRHSYDVFPDSNRTQPFGSGATCVYNYRDLQIRNDSVEPFLLNVYLDESHLHGQWLAQNPGVFNYRVYEEKHWISQQQGFYIRNNILRRKILKESEEVEDQYITENHALMMYSPLIDAPQSFMPKEAGL
jgi:vancomycin resistance protein VanW